MDERELMEAEREQELLEVERSELAMEALREARVDEERAGIAYPERSLSELLESGQLEFGPPVGTVDDTSDIPF
jgi:hypothetical protein